MGFIVNEFSPIDGISGVWARNSEIFRDERGYFFEEVRKSFMVAGVPDFVQDSISYSRMHVLRGMHIQQKQWQLVTLLSGNIIDVVLNLDENSDEYKLSSSISLDWDGVNQLLIKPGIAHGFAVLSENAMVHYKSTVYFDETPQSGVHWQSKEVVHYWPNESWIISARDSSFSFA